MIEKIKEHILLTIVTSILFFIGILVLYTKDNLIRDYIAPIVLEKSKQDSLFSAKKETQDQINALRRKLKIVDNQLLILNQNYQDLKVKNDDFKKAFNNYQKDTNQQIKDMEELTNALASKYIKVKLFVSHQKTDEGYIVLNIKNHLISKLIENYESYEINGINGNSITLKSRVEDAYDLNSNDIFEATGRLYIDDYHELFEGRTSGSREAYILLK